MKKIKIGLSLVSSCALGYLIGTTNFVKYAQSREIEKFKPQKPGDQVDSVKNKLALIFGFKLPSSQDIKEYSNYYVVYNRRTRNPDYVVERLTKELLGEPGENKEFRKDMLFEMDETEPVQLRVRPSDYLNSSFDRGHMAAAANFKNNETDCRRSFAMTNIAPQVGENFNRGIWNKLEMFTRALVRRNDHVIVITGPLYLPGPPSPNGRRVVQYEVIGKDQDIAVPTHFFKILLVKPMNNGDPRLEQPYRILSYVLPNQAIPSDDFKTFTCPLHLIEKMSGIIFVTDKPHIMYNAVLNN